MRNEETGSRAVKNQSIRVWIATAVVVLVVIAVLKLIDYRMQPPPPTPVAPAKVP